MTDLARFEPERLAQGLRLLETRLDPEAVNKRCLANQAARIETLGGHAAVRARPQFGYTPADSRQ